MVDAGCRSDRQSSPVDIDADHPATVGSQRLRAQLPEQSQTNDDNRLTQGRVGTANRLDGNGAQSHRAGNVKAYIRRNFDRQINWNVNEFCVICYACASAGNSVSDPKADHFRPHVDNFTGRRISSRGSERQFAAHTIHRVFDALLLNHLHHTADILRLLKRTPVERQRRYLHPGTLGSGRNARIENVHENTLR